MIAALLSLRPVRWLLGAIVTLAAVMGYGAAQRRYGAKQARQESALEAAERYAKQRKVMDDADNLGDDPGALRDWLRGRDPGVK